MEAGSEWVPGRGGGGRFRRVIKSPAPPADENATIRRHVAIRMFVL